MSSCNNRRFTGTQKRGRKWLLNFYKSVFFIEQKDGIHAFSTSCLAVYLFARRIECTSIWSCWFRGHFVDFLCECYVGMFKVVRLDLIILYLGSSTGMSFGKVDQWEALVCYYRQNCLSHISTIQFVWQIDWKSELCRYNAIVSSQELVSTLFNQRCYLWSYLLPCSRTRF
jgi:hypothetical protein